MYTFQLGPLFFWKITVVVLSDSNTMVFYINHAIYIVLQGTSKNRLP